MIKRLEVDVVGCDQIQIIVIEYATHSRKESGVFDSIRPYVHGQGFFLSFLCTLFLLVNRGSVNIDILRPTACPMPQYTHWSVIEHRTRKQDIELGNYTTQNLENMADLHGES